MIFHCLRSKMSVPCVFSLQSHEDSAFALCFQITVFSAARGLVCVCAPVCGQFSQICEDSSAWCEIQEAVFNWPVIILHFRTPSIIYEGQSVAAEVLKQSGGTEEMVETLSSPPTSHLFGRSIGSILRAVRPFVRLRVSRGKQPSMSLSLLKQLLIN